MSERRRGERRSGDFKIQISESASKIITEVKNLSVSGVYCQVDRPMKYMQKVMVDLKIPAARQTMNHIRCEGVIVRCDRVVGVPVECFDAAIYFAEISSKDRAAIETYIKNHDTISK